MKGIYAGAIAGIVGGIVGIVFGYVGGAMRARWLRSDEGNLVWFNDLVD